MVGGRSGLYLVDNETLLTWSEGAGLAATSRRVRNLWYRAHTQLGDNQVLSNIHFMYLQFTSLV